MMRDPLLDPDKRFFTHDFLADFIEVFKQHPCLWDVKSKDYVSNPARQIAWEQLLSFCESRLGSVDLDWLKRKVHSMKGSFNKELKRMRDARKEGFTGEWQPKLWYFENLLFTKSHDLIKEGIHTFKEEYDDGSQTEGIVVLSGDRYKHEDVSHGWTGQTQNDETSSTVDTDLVEQFLEVTTNTDEQQNADRDSRKRKASQPNNHISVKRRSPLETVQVELGGPNIDDEYEAIGKVVASKLRALANLDYTQFIRADKLITDAIFKGFQKQLTPNCEVSADRQPQYPSLPTMTTTSNPTPHITPFPHHTYNYYFPLNTNPPSLQEPQHTSSVTSAKDHPINQPTLVAKSTGPDDSPKNE
ncbi:hypothetical protein GE061_011051 [Apolygus lucorum]|uniref:Uncharacterized protein n=1 Tax=Apolygus lucorum TaxID=248454 RepID=A0A6A4JUH5_APOLU|nr:hypothetical protein GE061_011051 [Apolygus lucorum]